MRRRGKEAGLGLDHQQLLNKARVLAAGALPIYLNDGDLLRLLAVVHHDVGYGSPVAGSLPLPPGASGYYDLPLPWFGQAVPASLNIHKEFALSSRAEPDTVTYFKCLCEIHKRRVKYERILRAQPLPTMLQVAPRALLEFGIIATPALASWLTWRKWFYDIDNRSAQETGYLFEPILANALGGVSYGATKSPIRRRHDPTKGRQVDCVIAGERTAYEFKLRVTIAASGQGRFGEELDFAEDCRACGYAPVLLVLDPTPSHRLTDLTREYRRVGGETYVGNEAWRHLEDKAGDVMATFVEKYVRRPIAAVDRHSDELMDLQVSAGPGRSAFRISLSSPTGEGAGFEWIVAQREDRTLSGESEGQDGR